MRRAIEERAVLGRRCGAALFVAVFGLSACGVVVVDTSGSATAGAGGGGAGGGGGQTVTTTSEEPHCDCETDGQCEPGQHCNGCECLFECSEFEPCPEGLLCCNWNCADLSNDPMNCGGCGVECQSPHANPVCENGLCGISGCDEAGYSDCDGDPTNGCETLGTCLCVPGEILPCYDGPAGTQGVGACIGGMHPCLNGSAFGDCQGEVLPSTDVCNGVDDDCDGVVDPQDLDGDGFTICDGDCCDSPACAAYPAEVNPGAFEYPANRIDDDCDPATPDDQPYPDCSGAPLVTPTFAGALAQAMDLCVFTTEEPPLPQKKWGVISAGLTLADGTSAPLDVQVGVLASYGVNGAPKIGSTMAALSTGTARDEDDPGHVYPQNGPEPNQIGNFNAMTLSALPADFVAAGGDLSPGNCAPYQTPLPAMVNDSVSLKLRIRAPTNAGSFSIRYGFYTAESPENVCSEYNDFFVALLDSQAPGIPADKNIAFDAVGDPISVNSAHFDVCAVCPGGTWLLEGTGMGGWGGILYDGAATGWLQQDAPVVPGETIELRFLVWDAVDGSVDSLVLLDGFRWHLVNHMGPGP
ncbi:MAG: choice-of-anchor L domain-containing protein [Polyangiaceae bacterium]